MKKLVTLHQKNHIKDLLALADGLIIGQHTFAARLSNSFSAEEIIDMTHQVSSMQKELFIQANQVFTDDQLEAFESFLKEIDLNLVTGVIVADIGAIRILKKLGFEKKAVYNPETLLTNTFDFNFLASEPILGAYVAKEITLEDILFIGKEKKIKMFMVGHGYLNMFYSKRQLIDNYTKYIEKDNIYHNQQNLKIIEEKRKDEAYPILEDQAGTHVFRSKVFSSLLVKETLETVVDYLVIDSIFKNDLYAMEILKLYQEKQVDKNVIEDIQMRYNETWDQGFLYTKTIYKTK